MPLYDYQCRNCGHRAEVIHGVNDNGPTACERCGGPMRKLLTVPSIVFKGSGWAKKDARDARPTAKSGTTAGKDSTDAGKAGESGSKGESATATKSGESAGSSGKEGSSTNGAAAD